MGKVGMGFSSGLQARGAYRVLENGDRYTFSPTPGVGLTAGVENVYLSPFSGHTLRFSDRRLL